MPPSRIPESTFADASALRRQRTPAAVASAAKRRFKRRYPRDYYDSRPLARKVCDAMAFPGLASLVTGSAIVIYGDADFETYLGAFLLIFGFFCFFLVFFGHRFHFEKTFERKMSSRNIRIKIVPPSPNGGVVSESKQTIASSSSDADVDGRDSKRHTFYV